MNGQEKNVYLYLAEGLFMVASEKNMTSADETRYMKMCVDVANKKMDVLLKKGETESFESLEDIYDQTDRSFEAILGESKTAIEMVEKIENLIGEKIPVSKEERDAAKQETVTRQNRAAAVKDPNESARGAVKKSGRLSQRIASFSVRE